MSKQPMTPFEGIGGEQCIAILVDTFYSYVSKHPDLSPIFPEDLTETARKQSNF